MGATTANLLSRDVVVVEGPEAASFLHGQVSQDVEALLVGESRLSLLLEPRGRVEVFFRVSRAGEETFVMDTDVGFGDILRSSLERFKLRTKAEFSQPEWSMLAVRGPDADAVASEVQGATYRFDALWPGATGVDLLGTRPTSAADSDPLYEAGRVEQGLPAMGVDLFEGDIPNETDLLEVAVSFAKGCYRGQELVERIDARSAGRRLLRRCRVEGLAEPGDMLFSDGDKVGELRGVTRLGDVVVGFALAAQEVDSAQTSQGSEAQLSPLIG